MTQRLRCLSRACLADSMRRSGRDSTPPRRARDARSLHATRRSLVTLRASPPVKALARGAALVVTPDVPSDHVPPARRQHAVDQHPISGPKPVRVHDRDHDAVMAAILDRSCVDRAGSSRATQETGAMATRDSRERARLSRRRAWIEEEALAGRRVEKRHAQRSLEPGVCHRFRAPRAGIATMPAIA
jgi:hypothetical protein